MEKRGAKAERAAGGTPKKFSTIYVENSPYFSTYFSTYVDNSATFPHSFLHPLVEKEDVENYVENLLQGFPHRWG